MNRGRVDVAENVNYMLQFTLVSNILSDIFFKKYTRISNECD